MKRKRSSEYSVTQEDSYEGTSFNRTALSSTNSVDEVAGKIKSLEMINFMCHSYLKLEFNSRVNFITGRNGSGKSAIMVALTVVLGGSASLTNRGSSLTDLIKKGETCAKVSIDLSNEGPNSFKKDVYGPRIAISRNLSGSGTHGYVCRSANGVVVSKKKEEVESIVLAFNLQIKNPICVLNQDVARSFLCATDNTLRFSMFSKATQLEQLKNYYLNILELLFKSQKVLKEKQQGIKLAETEIEQLREKLQMFTKLEERVQERTRLENEYFWALVAEEEKKLQSLLESRKRLAKKKEEYSKGESEFEEIKELEEEIKECQERLQEGRKEKMTKTEAKTRIQREIQGFEREMGKTRAVLTSVRGKMERNLANINEVKEHLKQSDNMASQSQAEKEETTRKIGLLRGRLSEIQQEMADAKRELTKAEEAEYNHSRSLESMKTDLGELEQNHRRLAITKDGMKAKEHDKLLKFGQDTQALLRAIEEAARRNYFQKKPVGPCGNYVRLTGNPKWARAVESVTGGLMTAYLCDNQKDFQTLSSIMERVCKSKHPPIIIGKFHRSRHNVEARKVSATGFESVLDVLSFDNDVVFNAFIDQVRIETILLFETDQQAASVLTNIQNVPKNLRLGLTIQSDQYFPAPNYRTYSGNPSKPLRYFDTASKGVDAVKRLEAELREAGQAVEEKRSEIQRAREATPGIRATLDRCKVRLKSLKHEEGKVQVELNHLADIEETRPVIMKKVALEEELQSLEESHRKLAEKAAQYEEELKKSDDSLRESVMRLNSAAMEENEAERANSKREETLEEKKSRHRELLAKRRGANDRLAEINRRLKELEEGVRKSEEAVEKQIKSAEEICPGRIATERSPVEVQKLLEECKKYLKAGEKMAGSRQGTIQEYKTKMDLFKQMKKTEGLLEKTIETLSLAAIKKDNNLKIFQSHTANLVSLYFQATLQTRGYDGELRVDFEKKILDLEVKPKDATVARKDSKTLSGGERSYSTVSFILAIWKVVQMPVYFLDEFDVFMDTVNRIVIMDLLLEHANAHSNKQFVFITPQDISRIEKSDTITIYRLPDPERGKS